MQQVKAVAGFSTAPKKNPEQQRKILMAVPMNYGWKNVKARENHGLMGGAAPAEVVVPVMGF